MRQCVVGVDNATNLQHAEYDQEKYRQDKRKLDDNGWNIKRTSEQLGMQRSNLYKKIERYALKDAGNDPV